jgi:hypothetical protein
MLPAGNVDIAILESWSGEGRVLFNRARWEDLPTFAQVVNGLADLSVKEPRGAVMNKLLLSFNDFSEVEILG